ncbi:MAG TPA: chloride channel protein [Vicinamibacterales bacterium]|nr:chloride channel protein [Vicinamibacterales bacterium]
MRRTSEAARVATAVIAVAVGSAAFAIAFRSLLAATYLKLFGATNVVDAITRLPWWLRLLVPIAGGLGAGLVSLIRRASQNVSNVMEAVALGNVQLSLRTTLRRVSSSWLAIAAGLSIGREGPLIEFGGSLGAAIGRAASLPLRRTRVLVAAGTAAGFAAAYNTPFAAVLFVLETIVGVAALEAVVPTLAATVIASALTRASAGGGPIYGARTFTAASPWQFASFIVLALICAAAATLFKRVLALFETAFEHSALQQPFRAAIGGAIVGLVALGLPQVAGNGYEPLNRLLDGSIGVNLLLALLVGKIVATSGSVASGVPGGVFTPVLLTGGITGALWAHFTHIWWAVPGDVGSYALVGMAAATAASIHAPLTAAVLVFELSGDYAIVLPLLLVTAIATAASRVMGALSVYEAELRRRGLGWKLTLEGREVEPE